MYGVEDFAIFLYALTRMNKPKLMIELGSGSGACSLLCAHAMYENGSGMVISIDNGSQWDDIRNDRRLTLFNLETSGTYLSFLNHLAKKHSVDRYVSFVDSTFPPFSEPPGSVDFLFSDYDSSHESIAYLLSFYLPRMSFASSIFIDGGSSSYKSFLFLEKLIADLNNGKFPSTLSRLASEDSFNKWLELLHTRRFTLIHLTRQRPTQNSTTWIKIEPVDHRPYPTIQMH